MAPLELPPERYFGPDVRHVDQAMDLYTAVADLPLICPHGHVDPRLFADPGYRFGSPTDLFIIPDHYIFRMLYSQGIPLEDLGVPRLDGGPVESDHRRIWQHFAEQFHLFRGTPTGAWINEELYTLFDVREKLDGATAQAIYDQVAAKLATADFAPRRLYQRFNVEVLCTTDAATDDLAHHRRIRAAGWPGRILPTFRPDAVINLETPGWTDHVDRLSQVSGVTVHNYATFIQALEERRAAFKALGARATDHAVVEPATAPLAPAHADAIFQRALQGKADAADAALFTAHMLMEMARMSVEDGLVMQIHAGSRRDHNPALFAAFGPNRGADIPVPTEFTRNLQPLLACYGNDTRLRLILFTLDESTYGRELAPLAGHYPAVRLGPPWWFFDSWNGMQRFFDSVMETAGMANTAGFNDDTRAFPSIPVRHDLWRRAACNWLAGLVVRHVIDRTDAAEMAHALAYGLAKEAYRL